MFSLSFLRAHGRLIAFAMVMVFCSGPGQTYFVSLFGDQFRAEFGLSHGAFGTLFSIGTLGGAVVLIWAGRLIDRLPLAVVAGGVLAMLAALCALIGFAWNAVALTIGFFGLRLVGQGLTVHTAMTTLARSFTATRGRAIGIASLGHTMGTALLPALVVAALTVMSWRQVWFVAAAALLLAMAGVLALLRGHAGRENARLAKEASAPAVVASVTDHTLREVLHDPGLWLRLPALLTPAFVFTGLVIHQDHIAQAKGWSDGLMAAGFSTFAVTSALSLIVAGPIVDRFTARRLVSVYLAPLALGCLCLALGKADWTVPLFFGLIGCGTGFAVVLNAAVWAELYGARHLGAIRAFGQAGMGFASGLAPALVGVLIDIETPIGAIAGGAVLFCLANSACSAFARAPVAAPA